MASIKKRGWYWGRPKGASWMLGYRIEGWEPGQVNGCLVISGYLLVPGSALLLRLVAIGEKQKQASECEKQSSTNTYGYMELKINAHSMGTFIQGQNLKHGKQTWWQTKLNTTKATKYMGKAKLISNKLYLNTWTQDKQTCRHTVNYKPITIRKSEPQLLQALAQQKLAH